MNAKANCINTVVEILIAVFVVISSAPASAQTGTVREPDPVTVISVPSFGDFEITAHYGYDGTILSGYVAVTSPTLSFRVEFTPDDRRLPMIKASDTMSLYGISMDSICLTSMGPEPSIVNIEALPPEAQTLWRNAMTVTSELMGIPEFWEFLNAGDNEENVRAQMAQFGDGYHLPTMFSPKAEIAFAAQLVGRGELVLGRGYQLMWPYMICILTPDPPGETNPEIFVDVHKNPSGSMSDIWTFHFDPYTRTLTVSSSAFDPAIPMIEEDWEPELAELIEVLSFIRTQLPSYEAAGILDENSELGLFISRILEWSDSFNKEVEYTGLLRTSLM